MSKKLFFVTETRIDRNRSRYTLTHAETGVIVAEITTGTLSDGRRIITAEAGFSSSLDEYKRRRAPKAAGVRYRLFRAASRKAAEVIDAVTTWGRADEIAAYSAIIADIRKRA